MAKEKMKTKRSSTDKAINAAIAIVIVVVIALAAVALYGEFRPKDKIKDAAEQMGMSVEQFMTEYGIEGASGDTKLEEVYDNMTIENALKLEGSTFEDFMATSGLPETVTPDTKVSEVNAMYEEMMGAIESAESAAEGEKAPAEETPAE